VASTMVRSRGIAGISAADLAARLTVPLAAVPAAAGKDVVSVGASPAHLLSREALDLLKRRTNDALASFHRDQPLRGEMSKEELRRRVFASAPAAAFDRVLADLGAEGMIRVSPDTVALTRHEVRYSAGEREGREAILSAALSAGLSGVEVRPLAERTGSDVATLQRVAAALVREGELQRVGDSLLVPREALEALKRDVRARWSPGSRVDVAAFKELTGLSRKYVIPLLEYLDRERVTRRSGNERLVLDPTLVAGSPRAR
jgi:selenocysteine-specific elongation factor